MIAALELFAYVLFIVASTRGCIWLFERLEARATRRFQQRVAAHARPPADEIQRAPMDDEGLTRESLARLRARNDDVTAMVRRELADDPAGDITLLGQLIVSNMSGSRVAVAGIAALTTLDLALAQAEIVRLQAELDGERAAHAACHDDVRRAARGER